MGSFVWKDRENADRERQESFLLWEKAAGLYSGDLFGSADLILLFPVLNVSKNFQPFPLTEALV